MNSDVSVIRSRNGPCISAIEEILEVSRAFLLQGLFSLLRKDRFMRGSCDLVKDPDRDREARMIHLAENMSQGIIFRMSIVDEQFFSGDTRIERDHLRREAAESNAFFLIFTEDKRFAMFE